MLSVPQRYGQTDGRTTYDSNTALALRASRGKNDINISLSVSEFLWITWYRLLNCMLYITRKLWGQRAWTRKNLVGWPHCNETWFTWATNGRSSVWWKLLIITSTVFDESSVWQTDGQTDGIAIACALSIYAVVRKKQTMNFQMQSKTKCRYIPGGAKNTSRTFAGVSSSAIDRFLKFLHCYIQQ